MTIRKMGSLSPPTFNAPEPKNTFLSTKQNNYTYADLYNFASRLSEQLGIDDSPQNRPLLIITDNSEEVLFLIAACFLLNIPIIPFHPESHKNDLENILKQLVPKACYSVHSDFDTLLEGVPKIESGRQLYAPENLSNKKKYNIASNPETITGYIQTSGSSSAPKIVPVKKRQVLFAAKSSKDNLRPEVNKYWLLCLPLHHVGGLNVIYRSLLYGSAIYLVSSFDAAQIRTLLNENKNFDAASMVPTMLERLLEHSFFRVHFGFKGLLLGGGPITSELINRALTRGIPIVSSYGMTETCAQIAANPMLRSGGMYIPKKSVGTVFKPNRIEIRDQNNNTLPYLESGQIWLKGPQVFDGYLQKELNKEAFDRDGWFNTGDYGHLNRKGHLFIESRRTDLILSGGENINPYEIEEALKEMDSISEAAVVGIPDKKWGQKAVAFLKLKSGASEPDNDTISLFLMEKLTRFKIPKEFIFIEEFPKTTTGKIRRKDLRNSFKNFR